MSRIEERNLPVNIGPMIRNARIEKGYSLEKLAQMINVSTSYIARLENGERRNPSSKILTDISSAVGLDPIKIMNLTTTDTEKMELKDFVRSSGYTVNGKEPDGMEQKLVLQFVEALEQKEWTRVSKAQFVVTLMEALQNLDNSKNVS